MPHNRIGRQPQLSSVVRTTYIARSRLSTVDCRLGRQSGQSRQHSINWQCHRQHSYYTWSCRLDSWGRWMPDSEYNFSELVGFSEFDKRQLFARFFLVFYDSITSLAAVWPNDKIVFFFLWLWHWPYVRNKWESSLVVELFNLAALSSAFPSIFFARIALQVHLLSHCRCCTVGPAESHRNEPSLF